MKTSGISSATAQPSRQPAGSARSSFALTGRTVTLDPRTHAIRRDLADIRLADRAFAPNYAVAMARTLASPTPLRLARDRASEVIADLAPGETFEILEIAGGSAWGIATTPGLVGYIDKSAIDLTVSA